MLFMSREFAPSVTVAAVIEKAGQYLMVEESTRDGLRYNQPAGHLERGESLSQAVSREALEETAYGFRPTGLLGIYLSASPSSFDDSVPTYLRFAFVGILGEHEPTRRLDQGIVRALWLAPEEIEALAHRHRSPMVLQCMRDHQDGKTICSLDVLFTDSSALHGVAA
jgi:8-oxo-dGTP pyrophosphatase MutT (NUDIX family)